MHVEFSNFEIRRNSSSKILGVIIRAMFVVATRRRRTYQTRTSPIVRVQLIQKLGG